MKTLLFLTLTSLLSLVNAEQVCQDYIPNDWPNSRYINHQNGTITDKTTRLMWQQCAEGLSGNDCTTGSPISATWKEALQRPLTLNSGSGFVGYKDWRLPNKKELRSLAAYNCYRPSINTTIFPNTPASNFWSSSPSAYDSSGAWLLYFYHGYDYYSNRSNTNRVRLVRLGQ